MELDTPITPTAYLSTLRTLISSGRDEAALDYAARVWPTIAGQLTAEQLDIASGLLEGAESALALAEWEAAQRSDSPTADSHLKKGRVAREKIAQPRIPARRRPPRQ